MKDNGKMNKKATKAQSAMEYLMTYGWAILIIAVVLAALDLLGVFNGSAFIGTACLATPGYTCSNPVLATNGNLLFNFEQSTGQTLTNVQFACAATPNSLGLPTVASGPVNTSALISTFASGATESVLIPNCYSATGAAITSAPIGTPFGGTIWMYANNGNYISQIAKITVKAS